MAIVTLTSDFGLQNHTLSSVKARILGVIPNPILLDISHTLNPFNLQQTVYVFKTAYRNFPDESFHFVMSDLYAHPGKQLLYAYENHQHIFCADNGFMTMLFDDKPIQLFKLTDKIYPYHAMSVADAFVSVTASLLNGHPGGLEIIDVKNTVMKRAAYAYYNSDTLEAQVLYIDHFGNVVLNVTHAQFEEARQGRKFKILFMRDEEIHTLSEHYHDVVEGEKLCHVNSSNHLEISINRGNASRLFGFSETGEKSLFYNTIKIFFE